MLSSLFYAAMSDSDRAVFQEFLRRTNVVGLTGDTTDLIKQIVQLRQAHRLKLPDAIIAASALMMKATLPSADQQLQNLPDLKVVSF